MKKDRIKLSGMEFYAYHGYYTSERTVGNTFIVDVTLVANCEKAIQSDRLSDTINYQSVYKLIKEEMKQNSYLIEHIAGRIINAIFKHFPEVAKVKVNVSKINPPIGGKVKKVSICLQRKR